jgi:hypothetical protein
MAQSILARPDPRQPASDPHGFVPSLEVPMSHLPQDVAAAPARMDRIVAGRRPANEHDDRVNAPTAEERGYPPLLPLLGAGAPHKDAGARITAA